VETQTNLSQPSEPTCLQRKREVTASDGSAGQEGRAPAGRGAAAERRQGSSGGLPAALTGPPKPLGPPCHPGLSPAFPTSPPGMLCPRDPT